MQNYSNYFKYEDWPNLVDISNLDRITDTLYCIDKSIWIKVQHYNDCGFVLKRTIWISDIASGYLHIFPNRVRYSAFLNPNICAIPDVQIPCPCGTWKQNDISAIKNKTVRNCKTSIIYELGCHTIYYRTRDMNELPLSITFGNTTLVG